MQKSRRSPKEDDAATPRGRGRPRAFDRKAALARATNLFWSKGYEATSISDLTEAMGIGSPSLYAAFGSKEALYVEALRHYGDNYQERVWARFFSAATAREAVTALLLDSAASVAGCAADEPRGCMVTLSSVGSEGHPELGKLVRMGRAEAFNRVERRLRQAVAKGEFPESADIRSLARFIQTVLSGMSILARDGASRSQLENVAKVAMLGWDIQTRQS
jgi:AcrR family transcriptional regulator